MKENDRKSLNTDSQVKRELKSSKEEDKRRRDMREERDLRRIKELPLFKKETIKVRHHDPKEKRIVETQNRTEFRSIQVKSVSGSRIKKTVGYSIDRDGLIREGAHRSLTNVDIVTDKAGYTRRREKKRTKSERIENIEKMTRKLAGTNLIVNIRVVGTVEEQPKDRIVQFGPVFGKRPKKYSSRPERKDKYFTNLIGIVLPVCIRTGISVDTEREVSHRACPVSYQNTELLKARKVRLNNGKRTIKKKRMRIEERGGKK